MGDPVTGCRTVQALTFFPCQQKKKTAADLDECRKRSEGVKRPEDKDIENFEGGTIWTEEVEEEVVEELVDWFQTGCLDL